MMLVNIAQLPTVENIVDVPLDDPLKVYKVCQQMKTVCEKENGIGLSATQIGIPWKLFLVKGDGTCPFLPKDEYMFFADMEYKPVDENSKIISVEGCLSIRSPDGQSRFFQVERYNTVVVTGKRIDLRSFRPENIELEVSANEQGVVFQHEIQHHHGILISDIGKEIYIMSLH